MSTNSHRPAAALPHRTIPEIPGVIYNEAHRSPRYVLLIPFSEIFLVGIIGFMVETLLLAGHETNHSISTALVVKVCFCAVDLVLCKIRYKYIKPRFHLHLSMSIVEFYLTVTHLVLHQLDIEEVLFDVIFFVVTLGVVIFHIGEFFFEIVSISVRVWLMVDNFEAARQTIRNLIKEKEDLVIQHKMDMKKLGLVKDATITSERFWKEQAQEELLKVRQRLTQLQQEMGGRHL